MTLIFWLIFAAASAFLILIILIQEPKGGGLAEAFGGTGAETFGVKSGAVNRVTLTVAGFWVASAIMIHLYR